MSLFERVRCPWWGAIAIAFMLSVCAVDAAPLVRHTECLAQLVKNVATVFHYELASPVPTSISIHAEDRRVRFSMIDDTADLMADAIAFFGEAPNTRNPFEVGLHSTADFANWQSTGRINVPYRYFRSWERSGDTPGGYAIQSRARSRAVTVHELAHALFYSALTPYLPEITRNIGILRDRVKQTASGDRADDLSQAIQVSDLLNQITFQTLESASTELWADWFTSIYLGNPHAISEALFVSRAPKFLRQRALQRGLSETPSLTPDVVDDSHFLLKSLSYYLWEHGGVEQFNVTFLRRIREVLVQDILVRSRDLSLFLMPRKELNARLARKARALSSKLLAN